MAGDARLLVRFKPYQRLMHLVMFTTFLGLAATGLPIHFSGAGWARTLVRLAGGFEGAALLHRFFAFGMLMVFAVHLGELAWRLLVVRERGVLWGPTSLVPQPADVVQFWRHLQWFVGRGPRPRFDRYTYWEKFDYWAVFWGMAVIGGSGLLMWFPHAFSPWVPGWVLNVALYVHGEEALLATGFIFTIHFFNSHFRPEKFPMDIVMFTGQVAESDLAHERPAEYDRLVSEGRLESLVVPPEPSWVFTAGRFVGWVAVTIGVILLVFIVIGFLGR